MPGYQIKLVDPDGDDVEGAGSGEMFVRGGSMLAQYWHRADQTRAAPAPAGGGWSLSFSCPSSGAVHS